MPDSYAAGYIQIGSLFFENRISTFLIEDEGFGGDRCVDKGGSGDPFLPGDVEVESIGKNPPLAQTTLECAHQAEIQMIENIVEARIYLGCPVPCANVALQSGQPEIRGDLILE